MKYQAIVLFAFVAVLAGCDRLSPARENATNTAISAAGTDDYTLEARKAEAPILTGHESEIARDGNVLTISSGGKAVASLTDNDSYHWILAGRFQQADGKGGHKAYFIVRQLKMGTDATANNLIIDGDGKPIEWVLDNVLVFDGPLLASGLDGSLDGGGPRIDDWTQAPHLAFEFNWPCDPEKWLDANTIAARCPAGEENGSTESEALITRVSAREWRLREKPEAYAAVQAAASSASAEARPLYDERVTGVAVIPLGLKHMESLASGGFKQITTP